MLHKQLRKIEKICRLLRDILTCLVRKHHTFQRRTFDAIPVIDYKNDFFETVSTRLCRRHCKRAMKITLRIRGSGLFVGQLHRISWLYEKLVPQLTFRFARMVAQGVLNPVPAVTAAPVKPSMASTSTTPSLVCVSSR